jgi:hypothetical protein
MKLKRILPLLFIVFSCLNVYGKAEDTDGKKRETNYVIPIIAGALGGIALALWLRRRKG